ACARAGLIAVPVNYRLAGPELEQIIGHAQPSLLITDAEYAGQALEIPNLPAQRWCIAAETVQRFEDYRSLMDAADATPVSAETNETFAIFYTSGTTGVPKGALVSHRNLEMNGYNQAIADRSAPGDVNLLATPIYHMGAVFMAVTYMMLGCTQHILRKFEPGAWLALLEQGRASVALLVPTMINAVVNDPGLRNYDLSSLRLVFYGGGPMPVSVLERAVERLGCGFTQGYGLTETLEATFLVSGDHVIDGSETQTRRLASAGREAVGAEVRIVDEAGADLGAGETGEILIRSESVIAGYWNNPEETANVIRNGWFHTGDLGYLDEDRYLFVVDRKKDMVISGGVNIYSKEIESVLYRHPAVLEAAVIGLPDEEWGEIVTAVIALKPGQEASEKELVDLCRASLAGYKKPRKVFFLNELPKNPSGKILKRVLRENLAGKPA
ncbi:MAG: AMP-binding protein, partial [Gammaproteobacteria bacterium]|nr:AMP-binding protein [Gammaproteobacteria bacterium]